MKMHGWEMFFVLDARKRSCWMRRQKDVPDAGLEGVPSLSGELLPSRRPSGIASSVWAFDQWQLINDGAADAHLTFLNADGPPPAACGNANPAASRAPDWRRRKTQRT